MLLFVLLTEKFFLCYFLESMGWGTAFSLTRRSTIRMSKKHTDQ